MTPDLREALDGVRAVTDRLAHNVDIIVTLRPLEPAGDPISLHVSHLLTLLAALDPAEAPIDHVPTKAGLDYLASRTEEHTWPGARKTGGPT